MAKKRKKNKVRVRRGAFATTNRRLPVVSTLKNALKPLKDNRIWHPDPVIRAGATFGVIGSRSEQPARGKPPGRRKKRAVAPSGARAYSVAAFSQPKKESTCVRRKQRREVLHALRKTGKVGQKRPNWTQKSKIRCK